MFDGGDAMGAKARNDTDDRERNGTERTGEKSTTRIRFGLIANYTVVRAVSRFVCFMYYSSGTTRNMWQSYQPNARQKKNEQQMRLRRAIKTFRLI